jgi:uncharacterized pyridoxamine 5'-phosphate oxidase family protein
MARIKNTDVYPFDTKVSLDDHVIGTDKENNGKTKNYKIGALVNLFQELVGVATLAYTFSDGSADNDGAVFTHEDPGFFGTDNNQTDYSAITYFRFNHINAFGVDLKKYFETLINNPNSLALKIGKPGNPDNFSYFKVVSGLQNDTYSTIEVELIDQIATGSLSNRETYSVTLDASFLSEQNNKIKVIDLGQHNMRLDDNKVFNTGIQQLNSDGFSLSQEENLLVKILKGSFKETTPEPTSCKLYEMTLLDEDSVFRFEYEDCEGITRLATLDTTNTPLRFYGKQIFSPILPYVNLEELQNTQPVQKETFAEQKYLFVFKGKGDYGFAAGNPVAPSDFELIYNEESLSSIEGEVIDLGDVTSFGGFTQFINNASNPQSFTLNQDSIYFFKGVLDGEDYKYLYVGQKPITLGYNDTLIQANDLELIEVGGKKVLTSHNALDGIQGGEEGQRYHISLLELAKIYSAIQPGDLPDFSNFQTKSPQNDKLYFLKNGGLEEYKNVLLQEITSGGNYHNVTLTGNVLVLTNTNAQAIITGFDPEKYKRIVIINNSDYEVILNNQDTNSLEANRIKLPTGLANIGIQGSCELIYIDAIQKWQIVDAFASKYRPEHRGLTENHVEIVTPGAKSETVGIIELIVFRDAQNTAMTKTDLNTAYPEASRGFQVVCKEIDTIYIKTDNNTNDWQPITTGGNVL